VTGLSYECDFQGSDTFDRPGSTGLRLESAVWSHDRPLVTGKTLRSSSMVSDSTRGAWKVNQPERVRLSRK